MTEELKPCPFCGGEAKVMRDKCIEVYFVGCSNDKCLGFSALGWTYETAEEAIKAWNNRNERICKMIPNGDADFAATLACSVCGNVESVYAISSDEFNYCPHCGAKVVEDAD